MKPNKTRQNKMKNIQQLVEQSSFAEIARRALFLGDLNNQLQQRFPDVFRGRFRVATIRDEVIYCEVQNASLKQGILFRQAELLALAQEVFPQATRLEFKINPELAG
ncbi:DciA family protein [Testudinibacter sp. P80/BLE/0925]|uniref:DciA family protein n=1 Tax=Testudinibacter sp. TW-1 TaxID=3417757 RepID=UPI003D35FB06